MEWKGIVTRSITTSLFTGSYQSSNLGLVTANGHNLYRVKMLSAGSLIHTEILVTMDALDSFMTE